MSTLRITWEGGDASFEPGTTVLVGRDPGSQVQPSNTNVSRRHAEITHSRDGWTLRDVGSAQGTWRDGRRVEIVEVRGTVRVTLGREGKGEVLTLEADPAARQHGVQATEIRGPAGNTALPPLESGPIGGPPQPGTVVVGDRANQRPGGALRADAIAGATVVTGQALNVECAGQSYTFQPGRDVSIGRDADCEIVSHNPTVSRRHARITHDGAGWVLRDEGSSGGTYVDGKRTAEQRLAGSTAVWLGDPASGERLVLVASGTNPARSKQRSLMPILLGGAAALVLVVVALALVLRGGGGEPSDDELGRATVRLIAGDALGSGTVVDAERGLILTNAHVVAPDAPGAAVRRALFDFELPETPREVQVDVAPALGKAAEPRFIAEVVAVDGYLDLAVIQITRTVGGQIVEPGSDDLIGLVEVELGDDSKVRAGDDVRVFGYPGASQSPSVTLTEGVISGPVQDARIRSNNAMLNISAAISGGNSGGLAVNDQGQLIGVPTLIRDDAIPSMRPGEFAEALIEAAREGEDYESPYIRPLEDEQLGTSSWTAPESQAGTHFECTGEAPPNPVVGAIGVSIDYEKFESGEHYDLAVGVYSNGELIGFWALDDEYPVRWPSENGCFTVTVPVDASEPVDVSTLTIEIGLGPRYRTDL